MLSYIAKRILSIIPLAAGIIVLTFIILRLTPGDPALIALGSDATPEQVEALRNELGLNAPLWRQLVDYFANIVTGDLGTSISLKMPVSDAIFARLGATVELAVVALVISVVIGLTLGIVAALRPGSPVDIAAMLFAQLGVSMPVYWSGVLLVMFFAVQMGVLPSIGRGEPFHEAFWALLTGNPAPIVDSLSHIILPAVALGANSAAIISRLVRATMLEVLGEDYVRTAKAKGLLPARVVIGHALRNAMLPIISVIGLRFGMLLSSSIVTETIFAWPGLGQLTINAIGQRDFPLIQGIILTFGIIYALINLVVDICYAVFDPRVRQA